MMSDTSELLFATTTTTPKAKENFIANSIATAAVLTFLLISGSSRARKHAQCGEERRKLEIWNVVLQRRWEQWVHTRLSPLQINNIHEELKKLIVVNDRSVLFNEPPKRFDDLSPIARQILAGITPTISTVPGALLPSKIVLINSFNKRRAFSELTEGGRAFTKHCHRCAKGWWGEAAGPVDAINGLAKTKVSEILDDATWRNVFFLPGNFPVCEFRVPLGYGARWTWSPQDSMIEFRGFLEPPQENGHDVGWKH